MEVSIWTYPWDLVDEGVATALDAMQERAGATGVNVATVYHSGKFLLVHNPKRRVFFPRGGTLYFPPDPSWHGKLKIVPPVWSPAGADSLWPELRRETSLRGMSLTSWIVCLHNSGIGFAHPDCAVENPYGDRIPTDLCASNGDVRAYLVALVRDVASRLDADRVLLESLEYMPFRHDYHHEVIGVPTGAVVDFLMSLCFCRACQRGAREAGVDLPAVRAWVQKTLDGHYADPFRGRAEMGWDELRSAAGGHLGAFLGLRQRAVTSLLEEAASAVRAVSDASLAILDFGPLYGLGPDGRAWENGVDLERHLPLVDEIHPTFYFTDLALHRAKVAEYVRVLAGEKPMVAAISAILPETASREELLAQVEPLAPHAAGFSFYNYGLMAFPTLSWIGDAMRVAAARGAKA